VPCSGDNRNRIVSTNRIVPCRSGSRNRIVLRVIKKIDCAQNHTIPATARQGTTQFVLTTQFPLSPRQGTTQFPLRRSQNRIICKPHISCEYQFQKRHVRRHARMQGGHSLRSLRETLKGPSTLRITLSSPLAPLSPPTSGGVFSPFN